MGARSGRYFIQVLRTLGVINCLELGTCGGLSSMYLYGALRLNARDQGIPATYIGIEGCATRAKLSLESLLRIQGQAVGVPERTSSSIIHGTFEANMARALASLGEPQFVYIDGEHRGSLMGRYFERAAEVMGEGVIAIDDRTYNNGMRVMAGTLTRHKRVSEFFDVTQSKRFYVMRAA